MYLDNIRLGGGLRIPFYVFRPPIQANALSNNAYGVCVSLHRQPPKHSIYEALTVSSGALL